MEEPKPRRGRPPIEIDEEGLIAAATEAFALEGDSATMESIARAAGTSKPRVYDRFGSKEGLLAAVLELESEHLLHHLRRAFEGARTLSVPKQLRANFAAFLTYARAHPHGLAVLFSASDQAMESRPIQRVRAEILATITEGTRQGLRAMGNPHGPSAELIAAAVVGMCGQVARTMLEHPEWDPEALTDTLTTLVVGGLAAIVPDLVAFEAASGAGTAGALGEPGQ
jgi:AcrR family transcriptional regulator